MKKGLLKMFIFHAAAVVGCLLFPLYKMISSMIPRVFSGCFLHDYLWIYCPLCGGTRAVSALLAGKIVEAIACNALVVLAMIVGLALYVTAWCRLFLGKERLLYFPKGFWVTTVIVLAVFGILRNVLMIGFSIDPLGDLGWLWNHIK